MKNEVPSKAILIALGFCFTLIGAIYLGSSLTGITGFAIAENIDNSVKGFVGILFLSFGMFFFSKSRDKKAQAAMEFLMTYGWAILAMIIALSTLAYWSFKTDVGNSSAVLSPPLYAEGVSVNNPGGTSQTDITFEIKNNGADTISLTSASITDIPAGTCQDAVLNENLSPGQKTTITISCNANAKNIKGKLSVQYTKVGSSLTQISAGTISLNNPTSGTGTPGGGGGGGDTTPPVITLSSVGGDVSSPYSTSDNTPLLATTTNENAGCRWSLNDIAYTSMGNPCSSSNGLTHNCQITSLTDGNRNARVACIDSAGNSNTAANNLDAAFTVDTLPPVQSGHNPPNGTNVSQGAFSIVFTLNEPGECEVIQDIDEGYGTSGFATPCPVIGLSATCGAISYAGQTSIFISCQDLLQNRDTISTNTDLVYI